MAGGVPIRLGPQHVAMARMVAEGKRRAEIAEAFGYAPTSVSHIKKSPLFQQKVAEIQRQIQQTYVAALVNGIIGSES